MAQRRQSTSPVTSAPYTPSPRRLFHGRGIKGRGAPAQSGLKKKLATKTGGGAGRPARKQAKESVAAENKDAGN